ncbi:MAG: TonB-dependent receptor [Saprospiraceae bacterium]
MNFDKLGVINIQGLEATLKWDVLPAQSDHKFYIQPNITLLNSKVISGELVDRQLFSQIKHTTATKQEFVDKVNANPSAYNVYTKNAAGQDVLMTAPIAVSDLDKITKTVYKFGENGITNGRTPYAPLFTYNVTLSYSYKTIGLGISYTHVGDQYAEFANFENESGDGGLGKIKAFQTVDVNFNYDFNIQKSKCTLFIAGKNLADKVFVASRLNRGQSGIMPSGFRQINIGFNILL